MTAKALHQHFRAGLDRRDAITGLNDHPEVLAYPEAVADADRAFALLATGTCAGAAGS